MKKCIVKGCERQATHEVTFRLPAKMGMDVIPEDQRLQPTTVCDEHARLSIFTDVRSLDQREKGQG